MTDEQLARNVFSAFSRFKDAVEEARKEGMMVQFGSISSVSHNREPTQKKPTVSRHYTMAKVPTEDEA